MHGQAYATRLRDQLGNEIRLAPNPFAVGGEGAVFDVQGRPDLVAKLYSKPQSKERCDKLRAMAKLCSPDLLKIAAWPTATLSAGNGAAIDGILMPRIAGYLEIHHLYSVAQRKKDFPEVGWGFLLHTARNCAIAFEAVHAHGHVVGDVNQKNVMVSKKGMVAFVDCDSFQVAEGSRIFRCGVGVPEYTPPELHGKKFATLDRAANHDAFGLAVLIFHLLMMGRHPFSGVPLAQADIPIEKAIQAGYYAYTRNTAMARLRPPPHVPPTTMLDPSVLDLFERAFCTARRPTATEWRTSLDAAMKQLIRCKNDVRHSYLSSAGKCPWCGLIAVARLMFFLPGQGGAVTTFRADDIQRIIQKLIGMGLSFAPYMRPTATSPVRVSLPAGLRLPGRRPVPTPHPLPPVIPIPPAGKRRPPPPADPALPKLKLLPAAPDYPPPPELGPPDLFLPRLCIAAMVAGYLITFMARPVGLIMITVFASWWAIMRITQDTRRGKLLQALRLEHRLECERLSAEYAQLCRPIEEANQRRLAAWSAAKAALLEEHNRLCRQVDEENRRELAAWQAMKAAREADHEQICKHVDYTNRQWVAAWEAANAPWLDGEKRWRQRLATAEAERNRLESELYALRTASLERFKKRKQEAEEIVTTHDRAKQEYDKELRQAEIDSKKIQLEEHLDKALIRSAKIKGITTARLLSLESFGIETAKDVMMLKKQKVPGIGPVMSQRLFEWRARVETKFVLKQALPDSERSRIASRFAPVLLPLGETVRTAIRDLGGVTESHQTREHELLKAIEVAVQDTAIAEAHLKALNNLPCAK
jgi:DNA-binding helix-hairpin-helix protein with protein kinase domain